MPGKCRQIVAEIRYAQNGQNPSEVGEQVLKMARDEFHRGHRTPRDYVIVDNIEVYGVKYTENESTHVLQAKRVM